MKQRAPAADRNKHAILAVLRGVLPRPGLTLEIASGTGQHAVHFAAALPEVTWQPSDADEQALASIRSWRADANLPNLALPVRLDVTHPHWPVDAADAMFCANMIHIAPWRACVGLFSGAGRILPSGAPLVLYGPFFFAGEPAPQSNLDFHASLQQRHPEWGVRQIEDVSRVADQAGFDTGEIVACPANNHVVLFEKR